MSEHAPGIGPQGIGQRTQTGAARTNRAETTADPVNLSPQQSQLKQLKSSLAKAPTVQRLGALQARLNTAPVVQRLQGLQRSASLGLGGPAAAPNQGQVSLLGQMRTGPQASDTLQRVVIVKNKKSKFIDIANDRDYYSLCVKGLGDEELSLLESIMESGETYEFQSHSELKQALKAQAILDEEDIEGEEGAYDVRKSRSDESMAMAHAFKIAQSAGVPFFGRVDDILDWSDKFLVQTSQQRGDKSHVVAALAVDPGLKVVLCFESKLDMVSEGRKIVQSYAHFASQVAVYYGVPSVFRGKKGALNLTKSTETLFYSGIKDPLGTRRVVKDAITGKLDSKDLELFDKWALDLGFSASNRNKYILVSHRDSGHNVPKGRTPSHPEMDSGEDGGGYGQMMQAVYVLGFIPVPMGMPSGKWGNFKPNMVEWWSKTPEGLKQKGKTKEEIENGMVRYLAEYYGVRLLAMRSGNTDAMAFAGMETIFLDIASEVADKGELEKAGLSGKVHDSHNRSWRRAAMLQTILPGVFHQVFFKHPRPETGEKLWKGEFHKEDIVHLQDAIKFYFGTEARTVHNRVERDPESPIHTKNLDKGLKRNEQKGRGQTLQDFGLEIRDEEFRQQSTFSFKLNEISLVLEKVQTKLRLLSLDLDRLGQQLDDLALRVDDLDKL